MTSLSFTQHITVHFMLHTPKSISIHYTQAKKVHIKRYMTRPVYKNHRDYSIQPA